jgi:hypothetical protein
MTFGLDPFAAPGSDPACGVGESPREVYPRAAFDPLSGSPLAGDAFGTITVAGTLILPNGWQEGFLFSGSTHAVII